MKMTADMMRTSIVGACLWAAALLCAGAAHADDAPSVDCQNATTQTDMNICAGQDYKAADAALNAQYKATRAAAKATDDGLDDGDKGAEAALLAGQRAWIDYRDGECSAEGFKAAGGTLQPMLVSACKARMTRARIQELKELAETMND